MKTSPFVLSLLAGLGLAMSLKAAEMTGVVARIDLEKKELLVEGRGASRGQALVIALVKDSQIVFGRQPGQATDLDVGKRVHIVYELREEQRVARIIRVNGPRPRATPASTDPNAITGVLRRVALTDRELVVIGTGTQGGETETTVAIPETAPILKDGKTVTLEALQEGDTVVIRAEKRDGRLTALSVTVGPHSAESDLIPKVRLALRIADAILGQMQKPKP